MLNELSQREEDKYCMLPLICEILEKKKSLNLDTESRMVVARARGWEKWGEVVKRVQTFCYKMNKVWVSNV